MHLNLYGNSVAVPRAGRNLKKGSPDGRQPGTQVTRYLLPGTLEPPEYQTLVNVNSTLPVLVTCRSGLRTTCTRRPQEWPKRLWRTLWNKIAKWSWAELKSKYIFSTLHIIYKHNQSTLGGGDVLTKEKQSSPYFCVLHLSILKHEWLEILMLVTTKGGDEKGTNNVLLLVLLCLK